MYLYDNFMSVLKKLILCRHLADRFYNFASKNYGQSIQERNEI